MLEQHRPRSAIAGPRRRLLAALLACVLAAAAIALPRAAHAASSTTCTGTSHATYSPGLTFTPQTVTGTDASTLSSCTSTDTTLNSGSWNDGGTITDASCNDAEIGPGPLTVTWNNSQTSTASLTYVLTITGGILQTIGTGTITSGEFTGATAVFTWIYVVNPLQCLASGGLTAQDGTIAVQIIGL
ncbi:hypothetical protein [Nonomuraea zeae]|uniref:Ig-like domain-containing protein n=1 Tax=Nonomuraea zeae TaxID=1642303 RepID=A0A5S4GGT2_9ACTN|nr:hypothetical protein [Nonomuraea zeae]TMR31724.1 hypothetical protein ETD85_24815 [Nonomuraea zeae]